MIEDLADAESRAVEELKLARERIVSLEEDRDIYRVMAIESIHERAAMLGEIAALRRQIAALRDEIRRYRAGVAHHIAA